MAVKHAHILELWVTVNVIKTAILTSTENEISMRSIKLLSEFCIKTTLMSSKVTSKITMMPLKVTFKNTLMPSIVTSRLAQYLNYFSSRIDKVK